MTELAQHIENLLLENDCVILPGLGGFVAHHAPSTRSADNADCFLPPVRVVGFNPRLTLNDGLLAQSFMNIYHTNFPDASRMVERQVEELMTTLHEDGRAVLANVGELRYTIEGKYNFTPFDTQLTTPALYGLRSFELAPLERRQPAPAPVPKHIAPAKPVSVPSVAHHRWTGQLTGMAQTMKRTTRRTNVHRTVATLCLLVAVVMLALFPSASIGNTEPVQGNYAQLLPTDIIEQLEKQSVALTPVADVRKEPTLKKKRAQVMPKAVKEVKVPKVTTEATKAVAKEASKPSIKETPKPVVKDTPKPIVKDAPKPAPKQAEAATPDKRYCIIVASLGTRADAETQAANMRAQGHPEAEAIIGEGKRRVSIARYATQQEAYKALNQLRTQKGFESAWVLKQ